MARGYRVAWSTMKLRRLLLILALIAAACGGSTDDSSNGASEATEIVDESAAAADPGSDSDSDSEAEDVADASEVLAEPEAPVDTPDVANNTAEEGTADDEAAEDDAVDESGPEIRELIGPPDSLTPDCSAVPSAQVGLQSGTITSGGIEYQFQFIVPSNYDGATPTPMVLDFHGLGSNGAQQALFSGVAALAETEGFIAVEPTGLPAAGDDRNSWELPQFDTPGRDDVQMVVDLIDFISEIACIDPGRVYSMGMSNGALFTSELVCDLSERIAAAVSVAGVTHDDSCEPTRAVPYLAFHGIDDTTVPFNGGGESSLGAGEFFEQVMPEEFSQFADDFGCTGFEDTSVTAEITRTSYVGCNDDVELGFYAIAGAGHTWPGSPVSVGIPSLGVTNTDISATGIAWEFFQQNSLPGAIEVVAADEIIGG